MSLNEEFENGPVAFMCKYGVNAGDIQLGESAKTGTSKKLFSKNVVKTWFNTNSQKADEKAVRSQKYKATILKLNFMSVDSMAGCREVKLNVARNDADSSPGIWMFYLPWSPMSVTSMKIPPNSGIKYFFTAGLSGCSIFVREGLMSPQIYHAGSSATCNYDATEFWEHCMFRICNNQRDQIMKCINKYDYLKSGDQSGSATTEGFKDWLKKTYPNAKSLKVSATFGCVFGVQNMEDRTWKFYLQQRALYEIVGLQSPKKGPLGKFPGALGKLKVKQNRKFRSVTHKGYAPISVREIFPGGGGQANLVSRYQMD